jgi:hypothetical protein
MEQTVGAEGKQELGEKVSVLSIGGSQLGRVGEEMKKVGKGTLEVVGMVKTDRLTEVDKISTLFESWPRKWLTPKRWC